MKTSTLICSARCVAVVAGMACAIAALPAVAQTQAKPAAPKAHDDHSHTEIAKPASFQDGVSAMRALMNKIDADFKAGKLGPVHDDAEALGQYSKFLGRLALQKDSGVAREKVKAANLLGKEIIEAAEAVHNAALENKAKEAEPLVLKLSVLVAQLDELSPQRWVCDMHCEGCKVMPGPGTCPVCKMAYRKFEEVGYSTRVTASGPIAPTTPADLKIQVLDPAGCDVKGDTIAIVHEYPVHLIAVANDLSWYAHEHPTLNADGSFVLSSLAFPTPGKFTLFSDFTPKDKANQVSAFGVTIPGDAPAGKTWKEDYDTINQIDGYEFRIRCDGQKFFAGQDSFVRYGIDKGGKTVEKLDDLMGAKGHLVAISADLKTYVHAHPIGGDHDHAGHDHAGHAGHDHGQSGESPEEIFKDKAYANGKESDVVFHVRFPTPGIYRLFVQFKIEGRVITVPFTVDALVPEGGMKPATDGKGMSGHDHSGHADHGPDGAAPAKSGGGK